jgi:hypothetical protein
LNAGAPGRPGLLHLIDPGEVHVRRAAALAPSPPYLMFFQ